MDLFHDNAPKYKKILGIPIAKSDQKNIQYHTKSALYAHLKIEGKTISEDATDLIKKKRYLGYLMMDVASTKDSVTFVQQFMDLYNCENHD